MSDTAERLKSPDRLYKRSEVIGRTSVVPPKPGIYAWYFRSSPSPVISLADCWKWNGAYLLYVGISPSKPPKNGKPPSSGTLRRRISTHMRGNASSSTLRLSVGCLMSQKLGIDLRRVGRTERFFFSDNESVLSEWLEENAFVTWVTHDEPWVAEQEVIPELYLPLNLDMNKDHPFYDSLLSTRKAAYEKARGLGVLPR